MIKKALSILVAASVALSISLTDKSYAATDDITGITLEKEMRAMIDQGVLEGFGAGIYKPSLDVTRGQFATFMARALKLPAGPDQFKDVSKSSPLAAGINAASAAKIVNGYSKTSFRPDEKITREQIAAMINRGLTYLKIDSQESTVKFSDKDKISPTFLTAVSVNVNYKLINGKSNGDGTYRFEPKSNATRDQAAAFIYRMLQLKDQPQIPVENNYTVSTISNGQLVPGTKAYASFSDAAAAATASNQVVTYNSDVVKMQSGLVIANDVTRIYNSSLTTQITAVAATAELKYVDSDDTKVTVQYAGGTGYVKQSDVKLIPTQMVQGQNYYVSSNGMLVHYIFNANTNKYSSYEVGKAPSFLQSGVKYYSLDESTFYDANDNKVGTAYQYFEYLPVRTTTSYTADQLNQYIMQALQDRQALYTSNPTTYARYKDATTKSKLIGLGTYLKEVEQRDHINALFILSMGIHEGDYGMSNNAQKLNNIFGIKAYDSNPSGAEPYPTIKDCVDSLVNNYLNKNYLPPDGIYANGTVSGNKGVGINMWYATDPYWGSKVAGTMYRSDKAMGGQDFAKYKLGQTNTSGLNIRSTPDVNTTPLFTYSKKGYPVVILDTQTTGDGSIWYKIMTDDIKYDTGYVYSIYVDPLNIAQ